MSDPITFKPRARLLLQLGDELIKNESIALLELVKNAYDAGATIVDIQMSKLDKPSEGLVEIQDDGCGMSIGIVKDVWLEPGSDYKSKILKKLERSGRKLGRLPLGEKGIGRFSVHKLGLSLEMITRMKKEKEVCVKIDWSRFEEAKYIDEIPIMVTEREPEVFKGVGTGTILRIRNLRPGQWSEKTLKDVYRAVTAMSSPFETPHSFRVFLKTDNPSDFEGIPVLEDIKDASLYRFRCEMKGSRIVSFRYDFVPYPSMKKLAARTITEEDEDFDKIRDMVGISKKTSRKIAKEPVPIDLSANDMKIGKVVFEGLIFDRTSKILKFSQAESKAVRSYLNDNGGVRIYRDGVRVYDYGEAENDWLNLEQSRLYDPGVKINSRLILGALHLDRQASKDLIEKTNREGFVDNASYRMLREAVKYALKVIETYRNQDKEDVRTYYGLSAKAEPVLATIAELRDVIETGVVDEKTRKDCLKHLDQIENDYQQIHEILLTSAEAGLNLSVAIHEIEKILDELKVAAKEEQASKRVVVLIKHLSELIETYGLILKKSKQKREYLRTLVDNALFHVKYRLKAHGIEAIKAYREFTGIETLQCSRRLVVGSILNVIDNTIYWLERAKVSKKKLHISLVALPPDHLQLLIADNGRGFALPPVQMIKPFVSLKPGGMGLGLHIASEVMESQGGMVSFPEFSETNLPQEFSKGAVVCLTFRTEKPK